jgi:very-short-patch-repair endonuclease
MPTESPTDDAGGSLFHSNLSLEAKLETARTELLDLSARNRLLNVPRTGRSARTLEVVDERSAEIYRLIVREQKPFTFLPGRAGGGSGEEFEQSELLDLAQPDDDEVDERGVAKRHIDTKLQTRLTPAGLQKRLIDLYTDARTLEEEQGVNILFLALGTLKWVDAVNAAAVRYAPLILVPVSLERGNAAEKFKLRGRQEDASENISLEAFLDRVHGITLPKFESGEDFDPAAYMCAVVDAVSAKPGWSVQQDDIILGFFSFAKFLMYRDLDGSNWPANAKLGDHPLIRGVVADGFPGAEPLLSEDAFVDAHVPPAEMLHIVDSDSSQTLAVHAVRRGRNLVIQGPPGTGKSQTIANIIASAVADGKTVLFVAEKMAALEVVKRRLDNAGVGDAALELHSHKANKRAVLEELRRTWALGEPRRNANAASLNARLAEAREKLNGHVTRMHRPVGSAGFTPYQVIGHLVRLHQQGEQPTDVQLQDANEWSADGLRDREMLLEELVDRVKDIGVPCQHVWRSVGLTTVLPPDAERLTGRMRQLFARAQSIRAEDDDLAHILEVSPPDTLAHFDKLRALAERLRQAPDLVSSALGAAEWDTCAESIRELLRAGAAHTRLEDVLAPVFRTSAWSTDVGDTLAVLSSLPNSLSLEAFQQICDACDLIPRLQGEVRRLATILGRERVPTTLRAIDQLARIGTRVAAVPDVDLHAFASDLWDEGVERAAALAEAVQTLEKARNEIGSELTEPAWTTDLRNARRVLAEHGTGFFKILDSDWRAANRQVRAVLTSPKVPLDQQLALLDALARAQTSLEAIRHEATFAQSVFGSEFRGERSVSPPLLAMVEWVRSLRGLDPEARLMAARNPDRELVAESSVRVIELVERVFMLLGAISQNLGQWLERALQEDMPLDRISLDAVQTAFTPLVRAHSDYAAIAERMDADLGGRCDALRSLVQDQQAILTITSGATLGTAAFGAVWQAARSDWSSLQTASEWIESNSDIRMLAARLDDRQLVADRVSRAGVAGEQFGRDVDGLLADMQSDATAAFEAESVRTTSLERLQTQLRTWADGEERLSKWVAYRSRAERATGLGMEDLAKRLHDGRLQPDRALGCFQMSYFEAVLASQVAVSPEIASFDGDLHNRTVGTFDDLDRQRIRQSALDAARAHHHGIAPESGFALGPLGVLKGEMARKRGHMPLRQLILRAGQPIQKLKPVFMMSPLSVAQFLAPGSVTFDLLVMDEASQIQPVDALGAIARCAQVVVVGDEKQLPPTAFFTKMMGSGDGDEDREDAAQVSDIESILGLCKARGLPTRMLRWHYRSRHESLIAVSNRQFYENKLFIVPSPETGQAHMGLRFHFIENGVFESGSSRTNQVEATVVARAIIDHARVNPGLSLGVVAFSVGQRRAIQDQLELLRRGLPPEQEAFFQAHPAEPFFIKNLENVQGDERDVIFISVGYGPTAPGLKPPMRFGPVSMDGGERRINVLISRAKRRCEVFASMTDEDIDADFASMRPGVQALKVFMHYARTGQMEMARVSGRDYDSVFEEQVAQALQMRGYQVHRQVGIAGFFIDLAIVDPDHADRYLLGIECDGEAYHSARSARDRDRLRQAILEDHGWIIHRIWSFDWLRRPNEQLDKIVEAIAAARVTLGDRDAQAAMTSLPGPPDDGEIEREHVEHDGLFHEGAAAASDDYVQASVVRPPHITGELHEAPRGILTSLAETVVALEGPVHLDEIISRIRDAWGVRRAGHRIQESVEQALAVSVRQGRLARDGDFLSLPGKLPVVRDRSNAPSPGLRRPEALPPSELKVALVDVVVRNFGATEEQLVLAVSRAIGFKSTSSQLRGVILGALQAAIEEGQLSPQADLIVLGATAPAPTIEVTKAQPIEELIAQGENDRLEFKQSLQWDVQLGKTNKKLEEVVVKTIAAFGNREGGSLLLGVRDDGVITGLEADYACVGGTRDKFELHITNVLNKYFSQAFRAARIHVTFHTVGSETVCRIDVDRSRTPLFVTTGDRNGAPAERFFVRSGNSSQELPPSQIATYISEHFG